MSLVVDCHTHVFDASVPGAAENFPQWPGTRWGGSGPDLLRQMDEAGIDRAFLISYTPIDVMSHYPAEVRAQRLATFQHYLSKEYAVRIWQQYPDRFYWVPDSIDPRVAGYVERARQDLDRGAAGLKLLPPFVDTPIDDPAWEPIFELLRERGRPCTIDLSYWYLGNSWFAPSLYGKYADYAAYAEGMHKAADKFPDVTMLLAHYGTPRLVDRDDSDRTIHYDRLHGPLDLMAPHPNLHCDLAAYQHLIRAGEEFPYRSALRVVEVMVERLGPERVVWGTDFPYLGEQPYPELIRAIREAPFLTPDGAELVLGGNAQRIMGR